MSQAIAALNSPGILLPSAQTRTAQAMAAASSGSSSNSANTASSTTDIGSTFLNLLSTELQNQDPTAPVDSTAMVGQMISLNQLDQLISINQTLTSSTTSTSAASTHATTAAAARAVVPPALDPASMLTNTQSALPFDPNTMMPIANVSTNPTSTSGAK